LSVNACFQCRSFDGVDRGGGRFRHGEEFRSIMKVAFDV
jgi:hypothetical protein